MLYHIEILCRRGVHDAQGRAIQKDILDLGIKGVTFVKTAQLYEIRGSISLSNIHKICRNLLVDPITQTYHVNRRGLSSCTWSVEVWYRKGVTDHVAESVQKGIRDMGFTMLLEIKSGQKYMLAGNINEKEAKMICRRLLVNSVIQTYFLKK